jgi:L-aminopeptidase/D-esterase-like protein
VIGAACLGAGFAFVNPVPANATTGPNNAITDVPGILVGHSTRTDARTGSTVLLFPNGAKMGFAPSGGAPGDRLSSLLTASHQDSQRAVFNGVVLSGGSIYGLDTVCGVDQWLTQNDMGWGNPKRPFVPGAIIFDLGRGAINAPPGRSTSYVPDPCYDGYYAASHATEGPVQEGSVGGGTGASCGGLKSGFGTASQTSGLPAGIVVAAAVICNASGNPVNTTTLGQCQLYGLFLQDGNEFNGVRTPTQGCTLPQTQAAPKDAGSGDDGAGNVPVVPGNNTTIGVVATNANLTAGQLQRMAIIAGDGMSRAIRPAHANGDGDTVFGVSTAASPGTVAQPSYASVQAIYNAAADTYARAIDHAVLLANPALGTTYCTRYVSACPNGPPVSKASAPPNNPLDQPTQTRPALPAQARPNAHPVTWLPQASVAGHNLAVPPGWIALLVGLTLLLVIATVRRARVVARGARRWIAFAAGLIARPVITTVRRVRVVARGARRWIAFAAALIVVVGLTAATSQAPTDHRAVTSGAALAAQTAATGHAAAGPNNAITDVPGVEVGSSTRIDAMTGTTSLVFRHGSIIGYDSPGGAPIGHLETLLDGQHEDSQRVVFHGLVLSGGDTFGLDTICGTVRYLDEQGLGYSNPRRPHVPGGALFDLDRGSIDLPPGRTPDPCMDGYVAASAATSGPLAQGSVGVGTGATVGDVKGGLGTASTVLPDGTIIGALVAVNSSGRVYDPTGTCGLYGLTLGLNNEFGVTRVPPDGCGNADLTLPTPSGPAEGNTIGVIATSAPLTASQTEELAHAGTEGQAYAIRPAHGNDGDEVFAVTLPADLKAPYNPSDPASVTQTSWVESTQFNEIYNAAAETYARAIVHAVLAADPTLGPTYCAKFPNSKCLVNKAGCKKNLDAQKANFQDQQQAERQAFDDQQAAQRTDFNSQSHTASEQKAFEQQQQQAKQAFDQQQQEENQAFDAIQKSAEQACNALQGE